MIWLIRINFVLGVLGLLAFLLTGQYMHHIHDHLANMPDGPRWVFRSTHIYILLTSIICLFVANFPKDGLPAERLILGSVATATSLALPLLLIGFFIEPNLSNFDRPFTRPGLYLLFGAAVVFVFYQLSRALALKMMRS